MTSQTAAVQNERELRSVLAAMQENVEAATQEMVDDTDMIDQREAASDLLLCIPYLVRAVELLAERKS